MAADRALPQRLGIADLQVHTAASDGTATPAETVQWAERHSELDVLVITDHDDLRGALRAQEAAERLGSRVVVVLGEEVTTRSGHLLALFLEQPVSSLQSLAYTLDAVHAQGGLCVIPHPLSQLTRSLGRRAIDRVVATAAPSCTFDGIELANSTPAARLTQGRARRLNAERWHLAETGGSDAHFPEAIGSAVTRFPGRTPEDLRRALEAGLTVAETRRPQQLRDFGARRIALQQIRGLTATPRAVVWQLLHRRGERRRPSRTR